LHDLHRLYRIQRQLMSDLTMHPSTVLLPGQQRQRRRQHRRRSEMINLQLAVDEHIVSRRQVTPPPRESDDELELTLAVGSGCGGGVNGGAGRQRKRRESTPYTTPSSSIDSNGALHQCDLRDGVVAKQPQWLVRCLSLRMA
jgi:hypothetical protein